MKRSGDSTHHCRSPTPTVNGCDSTPSTRTQSSEQECGYLTASMWGTRQHRTPATPLKAFHEEPGHILSRNRQQMCIRLLHAPRNSRKFAGEWQFVRLCYGRDENRRGYHPALVQLFPRHLGIHSSLGGLAKGCPSSRFIHSCLPFCEWGWSICQSFNALPKRHATWHTRVSQTIRRSKMP